jgi:hypothetical protein
MLGTHFQNLWEPIPQVFIAALIVLLVLESSRFDKFVNSRFVWLPRYGLAFTAGVSLAVFTGLYFLIPENVAPKSFGIHSQHIEIAKEVQSGQRLTSLPNIPGLEGDRTKRYTVSFDHPNNIAANQTVSLKFRMFDASSGIPVILFKRPYQETFHLIVVDRNLNYFTHLHPQQKGSEFEIITSFPSEGIYHLYTDAQPVGGIDQQIAFTLKVGGNEPTVNRSTHHLETTKIFDEYEVTLSTQGQLRASAMSLGEQKVSLTIKDAKTKQGVKNLKPYLNAFGHLVMINRDTFEYIHVHPYDLKVPAPNANGGPTVEFLPIGIYGAFNPGTYRVFAQFNPDNKLFVADFTVKVQ